MNLFRIVFELFALYLLYKLIFDFIIPVARTTKQVKKQFNDMNNRMQETMQKQQTQQPKQSFSKTPPTPVNNGKSDDYIEFEEVK
jgi:Sec-independent protein translocase protein TatA